MKPIRKLGVFDSGVGGLSVLKELIKLPIPEFIYVADTANLPYGEKSQEQICTFSANIITYLMQHDVDAVVIACHTASAIALAHVQALFPHLLIIGVVDPVVQTALSVSSGKKIGVIATPATIRSNAHRHKILSLHKLAEVVAQPCPRLVPLIEAGIPDKEELRNVLTTYLAPLHEKRCDTLIIGCTHYELIKDDISSVAHQMKLVSAPELIAQMLLLVSGGSMLALGRGKITYVGQSEGDGRLAEPVVIKMWRSKSLVSPAILDKLNRPYKHVRLLAGKSATVTLPEGPYWIQAFDETGKKLSRVGGFKGRGDLRKGTTHRILVEQQPTGLFRAGVRVVFKPTDLEIVDGGETVVEEGGTPVSTMPIKKPVNDRLRSVKAA